MHRLMILALVIAGCASPASTFSRPADVYKPPAEYANYYDALYADFFWRCVPPEDRTSVRGYAVSSMRNMVGLVNFEVRLTARAAKGEKLAEGWTYGDRLNAAQSEPVPFAVSVPAAGEGVRYDLYYQFVVPGESGRGGHSGMNDFGTIEDACGPRYRRKQVPPGS
ncbi:MAG: hypothetical protein V3W06_07300 [Acidimicrobiia bacterium]